MGWDAPTPHPEHHQQHHHSTTSNTMNETHTTPASQAISTTTPAELNNRHGIQNEIWTTLKSSIYPGAKDESIVMAYEYCKARGLDILKKPVHIVPMMVEDKATGKKTMRDVIMPSIAEARITATRSGAYAGQDAPVFGPMVKISFGLDTYDVPEWCTVTVYRFIKGERFGIAHTEYFEEAAATTRDGGLNSMWRTRKRGQLAKCAEAGALRKGFPEDLGGLITADEMEGKEPRNVTPETPKLNVFQETPTAPVETPVVVSEVVQAPAPEAREDWKAAIVESVIKQEREKGNLYKVKLSANGRPGGMVTTFSDTIGGQALELQGQAVLVLTTKNGDFTNLKGIKAANQGGIA